MPALQLTLLLATVAVLGVFLVAAGMCFRPHRQEWVGIHLVKVTGPLSCGLTILAVWWMPSPTPGNTGVGLALLGLALGLFLWALRSHQGERLTRIYCADEPARLLRRGAYRWVRHPCYTSYLLAYSAILIATWTWWLTLVVLGNLALYLHAAWTEERKFAASPLAAEYAAYRKSTGMLFPNPLKLLNK